MPRFNVMLTVTVPVSAAIEVEAPNERAAIVKATRVVMESRDYQILDFDGNPVETLKRDIAVDGVESA